MQNLEQFRQETRGWLAENCPPAMRTPMVSDADSCWGGRNFEFQNEDQRLWLERMGARGWTVPTWPQAYGGGGLDKLQNEVLQEEMAAIGARQPLQSFGVWMLGPALMKFGSEALKLQHLPRIARGEIRWCQGYSEPNAGSDLAGLATRAEDCGEHFSVSGQKIWTSYADKADWMFCLVRTDQEASKHRGISFVLFDMQSDGVTTRPILLISGNSPFCEVFFDNVSVRKDQVVGTLNEGWNIAKYLLTREREMIGGFGLQAAGHKTLGQKAVDALGLENGRLADGYLRAEVADFEIDAQAFELTLRRVNDEMASAQGVGNTSAMLKFYGTELNKRRYELLVALNGTDALSWENAATPDAHLARDWLRSKGNSIEGGTSEIQLNIISRHILGLG